MINRRNRWGLFDDPDPAQPQQPGLGIGPLRDIPERLQPLSGRTMRQGQLADPWAALRHFGETRNQKAKWGALMRGGLAMLAHGGRDGTLGESIANAALLGLEDYAGSKKETEQLQQGMAAQIQEQLMRAQLSDPRLAEAMGFTPDQMRIFAAMPLSKQADIAEEMLTREGPEPLILSKDAIAIDRAGNLIGGNLVPEEPEIVRVDDGARIMGIDNRTGQAYWEIPKIQVTTRDPVEASNQLRNEFRGLSSTKDWNEVYVQYQTAVEGLQDPYRTADLGFMYAIAKIVDPGSVVREGEIKFVEGAAPEVQQFIGRLNSVLRGETAFTQEVRLGLQRVVERYARARWNNYVTSVQAYQEIVEANGANPDWVFTDLRTPDFARGQLAPVEVRAAGTPDGGIPAPNPQPGQVPPALRPAAPPGSGASGSLYEIFPWLRPPTTAGGGGR